VKNLLFFLVFISALACSDGELQIEAIDFDDQALDFCGTANTQTTLFFKLKDSETLILDLQSGLLQNEVSGDTLESPIPGQSQLIYRILSENVSDAYFCDPIPPVVPSVVEEIPAETGTVYIFTSQNANDTTLFEHRIWFKDVSFVNEAGERLTNLTVDEFGTLQTSN